MDIEQKSLQTEIWHREYNLDKKDNLLHLPQEKAVFGVFAIINEQPANCRYIGETDNLQFTIRQLFEEPEGPGLKKFFQGPWIKILQYDLVPDASKDERDKLVKEWTESCQPKIDEEGEYPGYYD
jgi:hypothetical protein